MNNSIMNNLHYKFENCYEPQLKLSNVYLRQIGEIVGGSGYTIDYHEQRCNEISYVVSGCCDFYVDGRLFHANQGDIHIISKGCSHKIVVGRNDNLRMTYMGFLFREDCKIMEDIIHFYESAPLCLQNDKYFVKTLFEQVLNEVYSSQSYFLESMDAGITQLLIHIFRIFQFDGEMEKYRMNEEFRSETIIGHTIFQTLRYIDKNIHVIKAVSQIADDLKYSPGYLSRMFKEKMGITLHQYVDEKKIAIGKQLLIEGVSVTETAYRLGYASSQSFCKMFSRYEGISPTEYLKKEIEKRKGRE